MFLVAKLITICLITITVASCEGKKIRKAKLLKVKEDVSIYEGESDVLSCRHDSEQSSATYVHWFRGETMKPIERLERNFGYEHELKNVSSQDAGVYACKLQNGKNVGFTRYFNVTILGVPSNPQFIEAGHTVVLDKYFGQTQGMSCAVRGDPIPEVTWARYVQGYTDPQPLRDDRVFTPSENGQELNVELTAETVGEYQCKACNVNGCITKNLTLKARFVSRHRCEAPQRIEVDEHESVRMNCWERCTKVFDAHDDWYPKHDYYFFVNGNAELVDNLPRDNWVIESYLDVLKTLVLNSVNMSTDLGDYFCQFTVNGQVYRAQWILTARNKTAQKIYATQESSKLVGEIRWEVFTSNLVYIGGSFISVLLIIGVIYVTWRQSPPVSTRVDGDQKIVIERYVLERDSLENSSQDSLYA